MSGILVAGIGNVFMGDDGFGVEVVARLRQRGVPEGAKVVDFGIRGIDLTYALMDGYDAAIMVNAMQHGQQPGTVSVIEPERDEATEDESFSPHDLDPAKVLRLARLLGAECPRLLLLACEPLTFGGEDGLMGLSPPVAAAIDPAIAAIETLVRGLLEDRDDIGRQTGRKGS